MKNFYPISLDIRDKRCVVVGGGWVALRKVKALVEYGAEVEVISPELCPELGKMMETGIIQALQKRYENGDLNGAFLAVAATDDGEINGRVAEEAKRVGAMVNVVDDPERSDFIVPSYLRRGDVTIAVSTAGRSPALARRIRTRLEKEIGAEYASLALLIDEARSELKNQGIEVDSDTWQKAIDLDLLNGMLRAGQNEKARDTLLSNLKRLKRTEI